MARTQISAGPAHAACPSVMTIATAPLVSRAMQAFAKQFLPAAVQKSADIAGTRERMEKAVQKSAPVTEVTTVPEQYGLEAEVLMRIAGMYATRLMFRRITWDPVQAMPQ